MLVENLDFPQPVIDVLKKEISQLNPPQALAVEAGLLSGRNIVVAAPTASGKTLIAELAILNNFLKNKGKSVYIVPLKALASEKYTEFSEKYTKLGMKIAISIGDLDSSDKWLERYDVIIVSNEKMDSLLRHGVPWISSISLVVCDEVHMLNDASRGPALEVVLTRLRDVSNAQFLALSATIKNSEEIAEWLKAVLVKSEYRPVKLHYGVAYPDSSGTRIEYEEKPSVVVDGEGEYALSSDVISRNKQALFFLSSRRNAEAAAERVAEKMNPTQGERQALRKLSNEALNALSHPTKQCRRLASCIAKGTAFHHAGLVASQRRLIEDSFRAGTIKILAATPTLAFGINVPAWRVYIRDLKRYGGYGADYIPVLEVQQMAGRAGRPKYDTEGEAILMAKNKREKEEIKERYLYGEPEPIYSKLSVEPVLRMHVLALVATGTADSRDRLQGFFEKTFFAHQYGDADQVMEKVEKIVVELESYGFVRVQKEDFMIKDFVPAFSITKDFGIRATGIGRRVSELYVDPQSAHNIIKNLRVMTDIEYLNVINRCLEMQPLLRVRKSDMDDLEREIERFSVTVPDVWSMDYEELAAVFKTSLMFNDWMSETTENKIVEKFSMTPGELFNRTANVERLLYAARELAMAAGRRDVASRFNRLRLRVRYGVKEELLPLVKLKGIGRVRARLLFRNGIKGPSDIKKNSARIEQLLGAGVARQVMEAVK